MVTQKKYIKNEMELLLIYAQNIISTRYGKPTIDQRWTERHRQAEPGKQSQNVKQTKMR